MKLILFILCLSVPFYIASALNSDGLTLLSLLNHWTSVPPSLNSSWNSSDSTPCSWLGVLCDYHSNVVSLNLPASWIHGQLGPEIGQLNYLQTLVLLRNGFSGAVPPELGNCSLLEYIDLSDNHFIGPIPYNLKHLQRLRHISLSSNQLTGQIPESLFQIPQLQELYLHNNSLSGPIPSNIENTTELLKLYLSNNQLSGTIPSSIGNCSILEALFLNDNSLKGNLPQSLNNLNNLIYLDVKNNSLGGSIPLGSSSCGKLFILDLSFNVFSGGIPSGLGNCSSLAEFAAVKSNLVGGVPSSLGLLLKLSILRLPENHLSGKIPPEIGNCISLKKLHLYSNQLEGGIPNELGRLSKLEDLELYFNHLTGEIPLTIWKIQSLKHILLHNNSLSGELPVELTELKHLKNISLFDNQFSGLIPQSLGINSSLMKLDLMNNKFTGNIPPNLCFGKQLRLLNLGLNQLQGGIPYDVGKCPTLVRLVLNENCLSGSLPEFESNQNLRYMDISKNNISGAIPSSLGNCASLTGLILSVNNITGLIPSELGKLVNLQVLNLAHNKLKGPLPLQLSNCTKMEMFDVGFNFLNGSFPSSLRSWTGLTILILGDNRFSGAIPSIFSEYDQLLELQLGGNMFRGEIPRSIGALQNLLYGLNLSANKLTGEIPSEFGHLQKLQSLDLSLNNLTGSICLLSDLSSLIEVNMSYNSFVGPLPEWLTQQLNFSPSSILGNPGLFPYCLPSNGSNCTKTSLLKPCDSGSCAFKWDGSSCTKTKPLKLRDSKSFNKLIILFIELGFLVLVVCLTGILLIYIRLSGQRSVEAVIAVDEWSKHLPLNDLRIIDVAEDTNDLNDQHVIGRGEHWFLNDGGDLRIIDLMMATENLDDQYIIGEGGHGIVYKAELEFGVFAVKKVEFARSNRKRLSMLKEIEISRKIRHQNVARCLGYFIEEDYGLTINRYMENGSLDDVLHENNPLPCLPWNVRYKIAVGIAKGLAHLHHCGDPPILHRDIKPKNILLDSDMQPHITDFGISIALNQSSTMMHMRSTYHLGTRGFMAPEIAFMIVPRCEVDVYSYGVVLLELITRKRVLDSSFEEQETTLVGWFKSVWREAKELEEIVDSSLARELSDLNVVVHVIKVFLVALICTEIDPGKRLNMGDIVEFFETPTDPGIFLQHDRDSFHLGSILATAAASIFLQEEVWIPANKSSPMVTEVTANLENQYIIGRGTHGVVYKAQLYDQVYAVKKFAFAGKKGKISGMVREIQILQKIRHRNLVKLLDFLFKKDYGVILYSYMSNGNLHDVLFEKNPPPHLGWNVRYKIAIGIAHGLAYLHYNCDPAIVHRAIKPKNILLDTDMEPHIADFGVAKLLNQASSSSTPSSSVPGTVRNITPENTYTTANTREFDVYSYGVVVLQLITRKKAFDPSFMEGIDIVGWVKTLWRKTGDIHKIVDSSLWNSNVREQVTKVLLVALRCTDNDSHLRPTMRQVILLLEDANPRTTRRKLYSLLNDIGLGGPTYI